MPIYGSGGFWCPGRGRGCGGDDFGLVFCPLSPAPRRWGGLRPHRGVSGGGSGAGAAGVCLWLPWPAVVASGGAAVAVCLLLVVLALRFFVASPAGRGGEGRSHLEVKLRSGGVWCSALALERLARWWWFFRHGFVAPAAGGVGAGRGGGLAVHVHRQDLAACGEWIMRSSSTLEVLPLLGGRRFGFFFSGGCRRRRTLVVQQLLCCCSAFS